MVFTSIEHLRDLAQRRSDCLSFARPHALAYLGDKLSSPLSLAGFPNEERVRSA